MYTRRSIGLVLVAIVTAKASAQSPPSCVELGTAMKNVSTTRLGDTVSVYACSFDRATVSQKCTVNTSLSTGLKISQTSTQSWASVDDLIAQYTIVPPLNYSQRLVIGGEGSARTTTYVYDGRKRVLREEIVSPGAKATLTWSEWDAQGRPTKGKWTGEPAPYLDTDTITYNDAARTLHREMTGSGATVQDVEFDLQGRSAKTTTHGVAGPTVSIMTIQATEKVCK